MKAYECNGCGATECLDDRYTPDTCSICGSSLSVMPEEGRLSVGDALARWAQWAPNVPPCDETGDSRTDSELAQVFRRLLREEPSARLSHIENELHKRRAAKWWSRKYEATLIKWWLDIFHSKPAGPGAMPGSTTRQGQVCPIDPLIPVGWDFSVGGSV